MGDTTEDPNVPQDPTTDPTNPADPTDPNGSAGAGTSDTVNPQVVDAITISSIETTAMSSAYAMASLYQHQVNHHRRLDAINEAYQGKMLKRFTDIDPVEAVSTSKLFRGESDSSISSILAQLSAGQEAAKIAQSTQGALADEISKMGAALGALQSLIGGVTAILQTSMQNAAPITAFYQKSPASPVPSPSSVPAPVPKETGGKNSDRLDDKDDNLKFPKVTVKFSKS